MGNSRPNVASAPQEYPRLHPATVPRGRRVVSEGGVSALSSACRFLRKGSALAVGIRALLLEKTCWYVERLSADRSDGHGLSSDLARRDQLPACRRPRRAGSVSQCLPRHT